MTIKSLSYIHNLLVNEEQKASLKLKWIREEWVQATDDFESGAISEENYRSMKDQYYEAKEEHDRAFRVLSEFEEKEW